MDLPALLLLSFLAGIYAPLGSPCVIILYPGYLAFLAGTGNEEGFRPSLLALAVASGVILSLLAGGILFGLVIQTAGPSARVFLQAAASALLLASALSLIFDPAQVPWNRAVPVPRGGTPYGAAFVLGLFMGIIILPCNAAIIFVLLTLAASAGSLTEAVALFFAFGTGMVLPLLIIAAIPLSGARLIQGFLVRYRRGVQLAAGFVMFGIAVVYLALLFGAGIPGA
jgi:cytochrome c-type biogenesis protein